MKAKQYHSIVWHSPILNLIYPRRCPVCEDIVTGSGLICPECKLKLPYVQEPCCMRCGKPVETEEQEYCYDCLMEEKHFVRGYPLFLYQAPVQQGITAMKYHNRREYAEFYVQELLKKYGKEWESLSFNGILPVPVHKHKRRIRGYNQAELLAGPIAEQLHIPMYSHLLIRTIDTQPQKELDDKERKKNLKRAFQVSQNAVKLNKVLLVDDIYTSGATIEACTLALLDSGVKEVYYTSVCIGRGY